MAINKLNVKQKQPSLVIRLNSIFGQLHKLAVEAVFQQSDDKCKYTIFNSAVKEQQNGYKFQGAGQHVVILSPPENQQADKKNAAKALTIYMSHFVGYSIDINYSKLKPIWDVNGNSQADDDVVTESMRQFNDVQKSLYLSLFENIDDETSISNHVSRKITGYYARFDLKTGTQNPSVFSQGSAWQQLKKMVGDFVDGMSFQTYNWQNGPSGQWTSIKDIRMSLSNAIDASKLPDSVRNTAKHEMNLNVSAYVDKNKAIIQYLKSRLTYNDQQKLNKTDLSLCVKIHQQERGYELVSKQAIADLVTKSITRGFFDVVVGTNKFNGNDVILINNYSDNMKDKSSNKYIDVSSQSYDSYKDMYNVEWRVAANKTALLLKMIYVLLGYDAICQAYQQCPSTPLNPGELSKQDFNSVKAIIDELRVLSNAGFSEDGINSLSIQTLKNNGLVATSHGLMFNTSGNFTDELIKKSYIQNSSNKQFKCKLSKSDAIRIYRMDINSIVNLYEEMIAKRAVMANFVNSHYAKLQSLHINGYTSVGGTFRNAIAPQIVRSQFAIGSIGNPNRFDAIFDSCIQEMRSYPKFSRKGDQNQDMITSDNDYNSKFDLYIVPMENLEFDELKQDTKFSKNARG